MILRRHWMALVFVGWLWGGGSARAQETEAGATSAAPAENSPGASSSFGSGATSPFAVPGSSTFGSFGTTPTTGSSSFSAPATPAGAGIFGTNPTGTAPPATGTPGASAFGSGGALAPAEAPASFTLPGAYGQAAQSFTAGQGVLARPRFRYSASEQIGFDDNILQTPTAGFEIPEQSVEVLVSPEIPEQTVLVPVPRTGKTPIQVGGRPTQRFRTVTIPGQRAVTENIVVQERIPEAERIGSFVARTSATWQVQFASRRTVFTFDVRGNADYYFSRPQDSTDLNGSISLTYGYRITPRMQFSASANLAYLSQPDIRRINTPTRNVGDFFNGTGKFDLSYRWTRRFTTVSSISLNTLRYTEPLQQTGNFYDTTFGTEARYLWSPRLTVLGEVRYGLTRYPTNMLLDSNTAFLLAGAEFIYSSRLSGTVRLGESVRSYAAGGDQASTPYAEMSVAWRYNPAGFLSGNLRYGFEESQSAQTQVQVLRVGVSAVQAFSSRLRGNLGLTFVHRTSTDDASDFSTTEDTFDVGLGFEYTISRRWSLNASYSFTDVLSSSPFSDYYRNRTFFGAEYSF